MGPDELTIEQWGFLQNPFSMFDAEIENQISKIDRDLYFLLPPYFDQIVGNPIKPTSSVVFGFRGDGKSILCDRMRQKIANHPIKVLMVDYKKFSANDEPFDPQILKDITLEYHIDKIINLCLDKFTKELSNDFSPLTKLDSDNRSRLNWFINKYHYKDIFNRILEQEQENREVEIRKQFGYAEETLEVVFKWPIRKLLNSTRQTISLIPFFNPNRDLAKLSILDLLKQLRDLIIVAGFASIYIIIDELDENGLKNFDYTQMSKFIEPLLTTLAYMQLEKVATKLFIPIQIKTVLGTKFRSDRIVNTIILEWSNERLSAMLKLRLLAFSQGKIDSLEKFVEPGLIDYFEDNVLYYSANNPRNLIRLIFEIISAHCNTDFPTNPITKETIINGIGRFKYIRSGESDSDIYLDRLDKNLENFKYKYIFCWDKIPEKDSGSLIEFLTRNLGIDWIKTAKFEKIDYGKTIKVSTEKNSLSLKINDRNTEVIMEMDNGREYRFIVKMENWERNIYKERELYMPSQFL